MSYGPPPPSQPPGPGGGPLPVRRSPLALVSLVLGILSVIPCCNFFLILSLAAVLTGVFARRQIARAAGTLTGDRLALAGMVLGVIGLVVYLTLRILIATDVITPPTLPEQSPSSGASVSPSPSS